MKTKSRKGNEIYWFPLPRALFKRFCQVLGIRTLSVYCFLAAYADQSYKSRLNLDRISQKLGLSRKEILNAVKQLHELHLIQFEPGKRVIKSCKLLWIPAWGKSCGQTGDEFTRTTNLYRIDYSRERRIDIDIDRLGDKLINHISMCQNDKTILAYELAEALGDQEAIQMYVSYANRFPEPLLREILVKVLAVPDYKIRKTRGALFNYLIQQHAGKADYYPRS